MTERRRSIENQMNQVSAEIKQIEAELGPIWFDVSEGPLKWTRHDASGKFRLMLGDRPLIAHKFQTRFDSLESARMLRDKALDLAESLLDSRGNR